MTDIAKDLSHAEKTLRWLDPVMLTGLSAAAQKREKLAAVFTGQDSVVTYSSETVDSAAGQAVPPTAIILESRQSVTVYNIKQIALHVNAWVTAVRGKYSALDAFEKLKCIQAIANAGLEQGQGRVVVSLTPTLIPGRQGGVGGFVRPAEATTTIQLLPPQADDTFDTYMSRLAESVTAQAAAFLTEKAGDPANGFDDNDGDPLFSQIGIDGYFPDFQKPMNKKEAELLRHSDIGLPIDRDGLLKRLIALTPGSGGLHNPSDLPKVPDLQAVVFSFGEDIIFDTAELSPEQADAKLKQAEAEGIDPLDEIAVHTNSWIDLIEDKYVRLTDFEKRLVLDKMSDSAHGDNVRLNKVVISFTSDSPANRPDVVIGEKAPETRTKTVRLSQPLSRDSFSNYISRIYTEVVVATKAFLRELAAEPKSKFAESTYRSLTIDGHFPDFTKEAPEPLPFLVNNRTSTFRTGTPVTLSDAENRLHTLITEIKSHYGMLSANERNKLFSEFLLSTRKNHKNYSFRILVSDANTTQKLDCLTAPRQNNETFNQFFKRVQDAAQARINTLAQNRSPNSRNQQEAQPPIAKVTPDQPLNEQEAQPPIAVVTPDQPLIGEVTPDQFLNEEKAQPPIAKVMPDQFLNEEKAQPPIAVVTPDQPLNEKRAQPPIAVVTPDQPLNEQEAQPPIAKVMPDRSRSNLKWLGLELFLPVLVTRAQHVRPVRATEIAHSSGLPPTKKEEADSYFLSGNPDSPEDQKIDSSLIQGQVNLWVKQIKTRYSDFSQSERNALLEMMFDASRARPNYGTIRVLIHTVVSLSNPSVAKRPIVEKKLAMPQPVRSETFDAYVTRLGNLIVSTLTGLGTFDYFFIAANFPSDSDIRQNSINSLPSMIATQHIVTPGDPNINIAVSHRPKKYGYGSFDEIGDQLAFKIYDRYRHLTAEKQHNIHQLISGNGGFSFSLVDFDTQGIENLYEYKDRLYNNFAPNLELYIFKNIQSFIKSAKNYVDVVQQEGNTYTEYISVSASFIDIKYNNLNKTYSRQLIDALGVTDDITGNILDISTPKGAKGLQTAFIRVISDSAANKGNIDKSFLFGLVTENLAIGHAGGVSDWKRLPDARKSILFANARSELVRAYYQFLATIKQTMQAAIFLARPTPVSYAAVEMAKMLGFADKDLPRVTQVLTKPDSLQWTLKFTRKVSSSHIYITNAHFGGRRFDYSGKGNLEIAYSFVNIAEIAYNNSLDSIVISDYSVPWCAVIEDKQQRGLIADNTSLITAMADKLIEDLGAPSGQAAAIRTGFAKLFTLRKRLGGLDNDVLPKSIENAKSEFEKKYVTYAKDNEERYKQLEAQIILFRSGNLEQITRLPRKSKYTDSKGKPVSDTFNYVALLNADQLAQLNASVYYSYKQKLMEFEQDYALQNLKTNLTKDLEFAKNFLSFVPIVGQIFSLIVDSYLGNTESIIMDVVALIGVIVSFIPGGGAIIGAALFVGMAIIQLAQAVDRYIRAVQSGSADAIAQAIGGLFSGVMGVILSATAFIDIAARAKAGLGSQAGKSGGLPEGEDTIGRSSPTKEPYTDYISRMKNSSGDGDAENSGPDEENSDPDENNSGPDEDNSDPDENNSDPDEENSDPDEENSDPDEENSDPDEENSDPDEENSDPDEKNAKKWPVSDDPEDIQELESRKNLLAGLPSDDEFAMRLKLLAGEVPDTQALADRLENLRGKPSHEQLVRRLASLRFVTDKITAPSVNELTLDLENTIAEQNRQADDVNSLAGRVRLAQTKEIVWQLTEDEYNTLREKLENADEALRAHLEEQEAGNTTSRSTDRDKLSKYISDGQRRRAKTNYSFADLARKIALTFPDNGPLKTLAREMVNTEKQLSRDFDVVRDVQAHAARVTDLVNEHSQNLSNANKVLSANLHDLRTDLAAHENGVINSGEVAEYLNDAGHDTLNHFRAAGTGHSLADSVEARLSALDDTVASLEKITEDSEKAAKKAKAIKNRKGSMERQAIRPQGSRTKMPEWTPDTNFDNILKAFKNPDHPGLIEEQKAQPRTKITGKAPGKVPDNDFSDLLLIPDTKIPNANFDEILKAFKNPDQPSAGGEQTIQPPTNRTSVPEPDQSGSTERQAVRPPTNRTSVPEPDQSGSTERQAVRPPTSSTSVPEPDQPGAGGEQTIQPPTNRTSVPEPDQPGAGEEQTIQPPTNRTSVPEPDQSGSTERQAVRPPTSSTSVPEPDQPGAGGEQTIQPPTNRTSVPEPDQSGSTERQAVRPPTSSTSVPEPDQSGSTERQAVRPPTNRTSVPEPDQPGAGGEQTTQPPASRTKRITRLVERVPASLSSVNLNRQGRQDQRDELDQSGSTERQAVRPPTNRTSVPEPDQSGSTQRQAVRPPTRRTSVPEPDALQNARLYGSAEFGTQKKSEIEVPASSLKAISARPGLFVVDDNARVNLLAQNIVLNRSNRPEYLFQINNRQYAARYDSTDNVVTVYNPLAPFVSESVSLKFVEEDGTWHKAGLRGGAVGTKEEQLHELLENITIDTSAHPFETTINGVTRRLAMIDHVWGYATRDAQGNWHPENRHGTMLEMNPNDPLEFRSVRLLGGTRDNEQEPHSAADGSSHHDLEAGRPSHQDPEARPTTGQRRAEQDVAAIESQMNNAETALRDLATAQASGTVSEAQVNRTREYVVAMLASASGSFVSFGMRPFIATAISQAMLNAQDGDLDEGQMAMIEERASMIANYVAAAYVGLVHQILGAAVIKTVTGGLGGTQYSLETSKKWEQEFAELATIDAPVSLMYTLTYAAGPLLYEIMPPVYATNRWVQAALTSLQSVCGGALQGALTNVLRRSRPDYFTATPADRNIEFRKTFQKEFTRILRSGQATPFLKYLGGKLAGAGLGTYLSRFVPSALSHPESGSSAGALAVFVATWFGSIHALGGVGYGIDRFRNWWSRRTGRQNIQMQVLPEPSTSQQQKPSTSQQQDVQGPSTSQQQDVQGPSTSQQQDVQGPSTSHQTEDPVAETVLPPTEIVNVDSGAGGALFVASIKGISKQFGSYVCLPIGDKPPAQIETYTAHMILQGLVADRADHVIIACNTASTAKTNALVHIKRFIRKMVEDHIHVELNLASGQEEISFRNLEESFLSKKNLTRCYELLKKIEFIDNFLEDHIHEIISHTSIAAFEELRKISRNSIEKGVFKTVYSIHVEATAGTTKAGAYPKKIIELISENTGTLLNRDFRRKAGVEAHQPDYRTASADGTIVKEVFLFSSSFVDEPVAFLIQSRGNPAWVPAIEGGEISDTPQGRARAGELVTDAVERAEEVQFTDAEAIKWNAHFNAAPDIGMLCCTHYPAMRGALERIWPTEETKIIQQDSVGVQLTEKLRGTVIETPNEVQVTLGDHTLSPDTLRTTADTIKMVYGPNSTKEVYVNKLSLSEGLEYREMHKHMEFVRDAENRVFVRDRSGGKTQSVLRIKDPDGSLSSWTQDATRPLGEKADARFVAGVKSRESLPDVSGEVMYLKVKGLSDSQIRKLYSVTGQVAQLLSTGAERGIDILAHSQESTANLFQASTELVKVMMRNAERPAGQAAENTAIMTGFTVVDGAGARIAGENDGPAGAITMARQILNYGTPVTLITDTSSESVLFAAAKAADLVLEDMNGEHVSNQNRVFAGSRLARNLTVQIVTHGPGSQAQEPLTVKNVIEHLKERNTAFVMSIERPGPNADGRLSSMLGADISRFNADLSPLVDSSLPWKTFGIGDGGNEIGTGGVADLTRSARRPDYIPVVNHGDQIATVTKTDYMMLSSVSNNGGVGFMMISTLMADDLGLTPGNPGVRDLVSIDPGAGDYRVNNPVALYNSARTLSRVSLVIKNYVDTINGMYDAGMSIDGVLKKNLRTVDGIRMSPDHPRAPVEPGNRVATHQDMFTHLYNIFAKGYRDGPATEYLPPY